MNPIRLLAVPLAVLLAAVASLAVAQGTDTPEITEKLDSNVDFSSFRTFGVVQAGPPMADAARSRQRRSAVDDRRRLEAGEQAIRDTILAALEKRGFEPAEAEADFYIGYDALVLRFDDPLNRPAELIQPGLGTTTQVVRTYSVFDSASVFEGRLTIFVVDGKSRNIVWSATAEGRIEHLRNIENNAHVLVAEMMDRMPR